MRLRALHMLLCILALACSLPVCASAGTAPGMMPGTFDVTLSGSSSYSVPIKIAPGSAGTQPQLQFLYDSQALGGALGAGWSLGGLSVITRGPHDQFVDGRPGAIGLDEEDALYLDGQRIVPISPPKGIGISRKVEFRKVNDDFSQIEQFGPDLNHSYFRVRSKGGITLVFGNPEIISPRATDPGLLDATIRVADQSVSAFAESAAIDTAGNFVRFHYSSNGFGDYNISDIYYTGHGSIDGTGVINEYQKPYAALTFSYEPAPRPIEAYVGGQLIRKEVRLTNVYSCVFDKPFVDRESCTGSTPTVSERRQATHYRLEYQDTSTAARFTLKQIHMFGTDDGTEISPTNFNYSRPNFGWISNPYTLPVGLVLAATERLGGAYRFVHFAPDTSGTVDLLFSAQIAGKNVAFAFKNNGASSWTAGGIPWTPMSGQGDVDFTPPVAFVSADGGDMGVILADITGTGRAAIIQNNVSGTHSDVHTYLAGPQKFESHDEYKIPFVVSRDGKVVGHYFLANWTGGSGPDMIYDSDGQKGFLRNGGLGVGWQPAADARFVPPIPLDGRSHLIDFACNGGSPLLVGVAPAPSTGKLEWHVYRMGNAGWKEELGANFKPDNPNLKTPIPPTTDPEAIREVSFSNSGSSCKGLLVATAVGAGSHSALSPTPTGWEELDSVPPFDLVDAKGNPSHAIVANLTGDGFSGIIA